MVPKRSRSHTLGQVTSSWSTDPCRHKDLCGESLTLNSEMLVKKNTPVLAHPLTKCGLSSHASPSAHGEEQRQKLRGDVRAHRAHTEPTGSRHICKQDRSRGGSCLGKDQGVENTECDQETTSRCVVREALRKWGFSWEWRTEHSSLEDFQVGERAGTQALSFV